MNKKNGEEKVKLSRIARIDEEIRSGRYLNAEELAVKLEVSSRTILRDIEYLRYSYDAPIEYDTFKRGYYYSEPNFFIRSVMLSKEELETITIYDQITKIGTYDEDAFSIKFRKTIDKLLMALPEEEVNSLLFSPTPENRPDFLIQPNIQIDGEINSMIVSAIENKEVIEIEYWKSDNRKYANLTIDPLQIFFKRQHYYLLALNSRSNFEEPGVYSINRMRQVKRTRNHFEIPENFKTSDYIKDGKKLTPKDDKLYVFELLFPKEIGDEAIEKIYYHNQVIKCCEDGSVFVSFRSTQLYGVFYWVLSQGNRVKVLNPPELVRMIQKEVQKVVQYYV